jgi:DNA-binding NarL/FixJ family response regulator
LGAGPEAIIANILIADDNAIIRGLLKKLLSAHDGWSVCGEAVDGEQVLTMAVRLKPDLIVVDFAMPVLDGVRAAAEIMKANPQVPIVLYTQYSDDQLAHVAETAGIRRVISKSDNVSELVRCLEELLQETKATAPSSEAQISGDAATPDQHPAKKMTRSGGTA